MFRKKTDNIIAVAADDDIVVIDPKGYSNIVINIGKSIKKTIAVNSYVYYLYTSGATVGVGAIKLRDSSFDILWEEAIGTYDGFADMAIIYDSEIIVVSMSSQIVTLRYNGEVISTKSIDCQNIRLVGPGKYKLVGLCDYEMAIILPSGEIDRKVEIEANDAIVIGDDILAVKADSVVLFNSMLYVSHENNIGYEIDRIVRSYNGDVFGVSFRNATIYKFDEYMMTCDEFVNIPRMSVASYSDNNIVEDTGGDYRYYIGHDPSADGVQVGDIISITDSTSGRWDGIGYKIVDLGSDYIKYRDYTHGQGLGDDSGGTADAAVTRVGQTFSDIAIDRYGRIVVVDYDTKKLHILTQLFEYQYDLSAYSSVDLSRYSTGFFSIGKNESTSSFHVSFKADSFLATINESILMEKGSLGLDNYLYTEKINEYSYVADGRYVYMIAGGSVVSAHTAPGEIVSITQDSSLLWVVSEIYGDRYYVEACNPVNLSVVYKYIIGPDKSANNEVDSDTGQNITEVGDGVYRIGLSHVASTIASIGDYIMILGSQDGKWDGGPFKILDIVDNDYIEYEDTLNGYGLGDDTSGTASWRIVKLAKIVDIGAFDGGTLLTIWDNSELITFGADGTLGIESFLEYTSGTDTTLLIPEPKTKRICGSDEVIITVGGGTDSSVASVPSFVIVTKNLIKAVESPILIPYDSTYKNVVSFNKLTNAIYNIINDGVSNTLYEITSTGTLINTINNALPSSSAAEEITFNAYGDVVILYNDTYPAIRVYFSDTMLPATPNYFDTRLDANTIDVSGEIAPGNTNKLLLQKKQMWDSMKNSKIQTWAGYDKVSSDLVIIVTSLNFGGEIMGLDIVVDYETDAGDSGQIKLVKSGNVYTGKTKINEKSLFVILSYKVVFLGNNRTEYYQEIISFDRKE